MSEQEEKEFAKTVLTNQIERLKRLIDIADNEDLFVTLETDLERKKLLLIDLSL